MTEKALVFMVGAAGYSGIEILARGYTHWSMALTGGICLLGLVWITQRFGTKPLWLQAAMGSGLITLTELCVGLVVNVWLGWAIWDYSKTPFNFLGQICARYTLYWFLLSFGVCFFVQNIHRVRTARHQQK